MNDLKGIIEDCNKSDLVSDKVIKKIIEIIGQEEWQDLHDENSDICTTMGELIITLNGIAELEKSCDETQELLDKQIEATYKLDKENVELDCQKNRNKFCYSCANATEKCFKNEIGCPCDKYKSYKEELKKWKDEWQEQVQKATDEGYARTLQTIQLTKAKEIIKYLCGMVRELNKLNVQLTNVDYSLAEAEQFLSEVDK